MSAANLLVILKSRGIELSMYGHELRYRSIKKGSYTPELRTQVAEQRSEIIRILSQSVANKSNLPITLWPTDLATWVKQLSAADLPWAPFRLWPWSTVTNAASFLAWLQLAAGRRRTPRLGDSTPAADARRLRELMVETRSSRHSPHVQSITPCDPAAALFD